MKLENFLVHTDNGPVQGCERVSIFCRSYGNFQGIPYMKAPVGKLRFRDPQLPEKWSEPLDATNEPPSYFSFHSSKSGQEDAGVLNVFVPITVQSELLPVLVYLYGGGFQMGSSKTDFYGPDYFMEKDVVLVTINYRPGPIGFLCLNDASLCVPGNAGLKDQCLALKWVQENIKNFRGNPENVTLFGDSAGGASTHYHMISDQSKGLFHKAIIMSGCAFNKTWAMPPKKNFAQRLAKKLGWDETGGEKKLLEVLEAADPYDLMRESAPTNILNDEDFAEFIIFAFCPVIEPYTTKTTFIHDDPVMMAREAWSKNISCIIGGTSFEGVFATIFERKENFIDAFENANYFAPLSELVLKVTSDDAARFGTRIKKIYFEYAHVTNTNYELFCQYATDRHFWHGLQNAVKSRLSVGGRGRTYLYRFDASTELNLLKKYNKAESFSGAIHGDTIFYLFASIYLEPPTVESKEFQLIKEMTDLFANFARTGYPYESESQIWLPVTSPKPPLTCLNISEKKTELIALPEGDRLMIWDTVYKDAKVPMF